MNLLAAALERDEHQDGANGDRREIRPAEPLQVRPPLQRGIGELEQAERQQQPEEPPPPREIISPIIGITAKARWHEDRANEVEKDGEIEDEQVELEGPLLQPRQAELPPPPEQGVVEHQHDPQQVDPVELLALRLLDHPCDALE